MRLLPFLTLALFTSHCGVEAGNVGKGRTGQVKVLFAQETSASGESLNVTVGSLGLLNSDDSEAATLSPTVSDVDLYNSSSSESVLVAESSVIPVGTYAKVAVRLSGAKPVRYRDERGQNHDVSLENEKDDSFYIVQDIHVVEGEMTTVVINIDPYQSLNRPAGDKFVFKPRGEISRHNDDLRYKGTTNVANAKWACLYAYDLQGRGGPLGPRDFPRLKDPEDGRDSGRGRPVEGRPSFGTKDEMVKDTTSDCANAYAKTFVKEGKFEFRFLELGKYSLRIFAADGSYQDAAEDITMTPNK